MEVKGCGGTFPRKNLPAHQAHDCAKRLVKCDFGCPEHMPLSAVAAHDDAAMKAHLRVMMTRYQELAEQARASEAKLDTLLSGRGPWSFGNILLVQPEGVAPVLKFDAQAQSVSAVVAAGGPTSRRYATVAKRDASEIFVIGGQANKHTTSSVYAFNTLTRTWRRPAAMPHPLAAAGAIACNGRFLVFGEPAPLGARTWS